MFRIKTDIRQYKCESPDKVEKLIRNWVIRPTDLIYNAENAGWTPIGEHPVFTPLFELLNEQIRNEPDTLVTRHPQPQLQPPSAPEGVEESLASSDEITTMTHRTQILLGAEVEEIEEEDNDNLSSSPSTEPARKIGRHDLPEELFATAELHGPISRDDVFPRIDDLAELSEHEQEVDDDEHTKVVEFQPEHDSEHDDDEHTKVVEFQPENDSEERSADETAEESSPLATEPAEDLTATTESDAFTRTAPWNTPDSSIPEENDDELILAQAIPTESEPETPDDSTSETAETRELPQPRALTKDTTETEESEESEESQKTEDIQKAADSPEPPAESTPDTPTLELSQPDESTARLDDTATDDQEDKKEDPKTESKIPEGYTVQLPPIGPTEEDILYGLALSTLTDEEKDRTFHVPTPQPLSTVVKQTFYLDASPQTAASSSTTSHPTADFPRIDDPSDNATPGTKKAMIIMAVITLLVAIVVIAILAT